MPANPPPTTIDLSALGNVPAGYRHREREVTPGNLLVTPELVLKWHNLRPAGSVIPESAITDARAFVRAEAGAGAIERGHGLGFVVFHSSTELGYVLVCTWYQTQELWITLYVKHLGSDDLYERKQSGRDWSTACVWELAPIWHERQAWSAYLGTMRDDAAKQVYLDDTFAGLV